MTVDSATLDKKSSDDFLPQFRAVRVGEARRGIRLEKIFWKILAELATKNSVHVGDVVSDCEARFPESGNITSLLRVRAAEWLWQEIARVRLSTGKDILDSHIHACPSPAFALTADKKIIAYNQSFLTFVQARLSRFSGGSMAKGLRLLLDVQISELIESLKKDRSRPALTGFVVGIEGQTIRGRMNAVLAPMTDQDTILGYILPN